jgi:prolyl oligopeptidase
MARQENENWVWKEFHFLEPDYDRCLIQLSRGGADATVVREFDTRTLQFVEGGFQLPEAKSDVAWRGRDSLFVATDFGPGSLTDSGYPRIVKMWQRGTPLEEARAVFEAGPEDVAASGTRDQTRGFERDFITRSVNFWETEVFLWRDGKLIKLEKPNDANLSTHREWLFLELRTPWTIGDTTWPAGALLAIKFEEFLSGGRRFAALFEPAERKSLAGMSPTLNHVIVTELENVRNKVFVLTHQNGSWRREPLGGLPEFSTANAFAVDADESDDYFLVVSDYLTPTTLSLGRLGAARTERLKSSPSFFDAKGLAISQHEAISADGTRIPYYQVAREGLVLDGGNPTLLYGYGGFEISQVPRYEATTGAAWLEAGGVYVVANIRGGGEFGPKWHQAALKQNRPRAYEDFIAVANDLIARRVTSPAHLGIMGGSNGGLLMGNMLTMRPDLFGAIVCQVPLLDMRRYHKLLAGASWVAEFGDPDDPEEWKFLQTFSPYHQLRRDAKYPRVLFTTSTRDDRVHPAHARKMVARMQELGHDVLYYENVEGGHGGAANNRQAAFMWALAFTYLWQQLR